MEEITNLAKKLELHYYFDDGSHCMDATIYNKCEGEVLAIAKELATQLNLQVEFNIEAISEGGLRERLAILVQNHPIATNIFIGILIHILSEQITIDRELVNLQKEVYRLQIEKLNIEIKNTNSPVPNCTSEQTSALVLENQVIRKRRSNFYKNLIHYRKVTALDWGGIDSNNQIVSKVKTVKQTDFCKFILVSDNIEPVIDENATIEIIAPILKNGKYKWRGMYNEEPIPFTMNDSEFKTQVLSGGISFINGTYIDCVLTISRKLDKTGVEKNSGYSVDIVTGVHNGQIAIETAQGRMYKRKRAEEKRVVQGDFFREGYLDE